MHAADAGMMRIGEDRHGELDLGIGKSGGIARRVEIRHRIVGGIETVGVDMAEIGDRGFGARIGLAVGDPDRRVIAAGIERIDRGAVFLAADGAVEFAVGEVAQLVGDRRVGRGQSGGGRCRARRRRCCRRACAIGRLRCCGRCRRCGSRRRGGLAGGAARRRRLHRCRGRRCCRLIGGLIRLRLPACRHRAAAGAGVLVAAGVAASVA